MKFYSKYWRIARRLQTEQLQRTPSSELNFSDQDLFNIDLSERSRNFFLGYYSENGINMALDRYGVYKKLAKLGFENVKLFLDVTDPYKHRLALYHGKKHHDFLLTELVLRKQFFTIQMPFDSIINGKTYHGLAIDWLCMQNPYQKFSSEKPRLPGQRFPGLGMSSVVVELLMIICWRLKLDGLINIPEHYHNGVFYSKIFYYIDPLIQARFTALRLQFRNFPLEKISWGIDWECVTDLRTNQPFKWFVSQQVVPFETKLKSVLLGKEYRNFVSDHSTDYEFLFDEEKYQKLKQKISNKSLENII